VVQSEWTPWPTSSKLSRHAASEAAAGKPYNLTANRAARQPRLPQFCGARTKTCTAARQRLSARRSGYAADSPRRAAPPDARSARRPRARTFNKRSLGGLAIDAKPFGKLCPRIQAPWPGPISFQGYFSRCREIGKRFNFGLARIAKMRSCRNRLTAGNRRCGKEKPPARPGGAWRAFAVLEQPPPSRPHSCAGVRRSAPAPPDHCRRSARPGG